jgi:hypothetical protein
MELDVAYSPYLPEDAVVVFPINFVQSFTPFMMRRKGV